MGSYWVDSYMASHFCFFQLSWLIGKWKGEGCGTYPTIKPFEYVEEVEFSNDGIPFINYKYEHKFFVGLHGDKT
jgi:hypothetical protein